MGLQLKRVKLLLVSEDQGLLDSWAAEINDWLRQNSHLYPDRYRFGFSHCHTLKQALFLFNREHPDLILIASDFAHGQKLCREVRSNEEARHTGLVFMESVALTSELDSVGFLEAGADDYIQCDKIPREIIARLIAVVRLKSMTDELRSANHRLEVLSTTDELTGLANMRYFQSYYDSLVQSCLSKGESFAVVMLDLDRFKSINDSTNHMVGSFIISEVGRLLKLTGVFGPGACVARYGGDEFIAAFPVASSEQVSRQAEMLRSLLAQAEFRREGFVINVTASLGVCFVPPGYERAFHDPIKCADMMLYQSKNKGRNCVSQVCLGEATTYESLQLTLQGHSQTEARYQSYQLLSADGEKKNNQ